MYEQAVDLLKQHNLKITHPRLQILNYITQHTTHPTAEEIYKNLKKHTPSLSKTTVYNALETLEKHSIISSLTISGNEHRYDLKTNLHHHFLCTTCNKIIDIDIQCPNIHTIENLGYHIEEVHGYFKGLCYSCKNKKGEIK